MAENIVQMPLREYEKLKSISSAKQKQIEKEAIKLWKEKGVATLRIDVGVKGHDYGYGMMNIDCSSYVFYKDDKFFISEELRRRVADYCTSMVQSEIDNYICDPVKQMRSLEEERNKVGRWFLTSIILTIIGWATAIVLILKSVLA